MKFILHLVLIIAALVSANPKTISYQGVLTDADGMPRTNGSYDMTFSLYNSDVEGLHLWRNEKQVILKNGIFTVLLGNELPFEGALDFTEPYWLGIKLGENVELSPRIPLSSSAYAIRSIVSDSAAKAGSIAADAVTTVQILDGSIVSEDVAPTFKAPLAVTADSSLKAGVAAVALSVSGAGVTEGTVNTVQLADDAVNSAKILDSSIISADVNSAFVSPKATLADSSLKAAVAAVALSVSGAGVTEGTVNTVQLADGAVNSAKILDSSIISADVNSAFVSPKAELADSAAKADTSNIALSVAGTSITGKVVTDTVQSESEKGLLLLNSSNMGLAIDNLGQMGIGTVSPKVKFDISGEGYNLFRLFRSSTVNLGMYQAIGSSGQLITSNNDGNQKLTVLTQGGNMCIGSEPNPTHRLEVEGDLKVTGNIITDGRINGSSSPSRQVQRDFLFWNTTIRNINPIHIKTNIKEKSSIMYRILVEGYNYGTGKIINSDICGYTYVSWEEIGHSSSNNYAPGVSISQYYSSDEFVVIKLSHTDSYYMGFGVSAWFTNPTGNGFQISAQVFHQADNL